MRRGHDEEHANERKERGGRGGAQTFRRKRAVAFLQSLQAKEDVLLQQLNMPELQAANAVIAGELKAVQAIKAEFMQAFQVSPLEADEAQEGKEND